MSKIEYFEKEAEEVLKESTERLNNLFLARYKWKQRLHFFNDASGENIIDIETISYGILRKKPDGNYEDLIEKSNYDIVQSDIIEMTAFKSNIELTKSQILSIFKRLEEKYDLYSEERIIRGNYGEGAYFPIKYKASEGREKSLQEQKEMLEIAEEAIDNYRHSGILDKLFWRKTK